MTPDTTAALIEYNRLRRTPASLRMRYANLLAAARATLTATRDDEANPLAYLIDELAAQGQLPPAETGTAILDSDGLSAWLMTSLNAAHDWAEDGDQR